MGKRLLICSILITGFIILCSGCQSTQHEKIVEPDTIKIGVSVYDQYDTFVAKLMEKFKQYASERETETGIAITIDVYNAADSQSTQNGQVESMIGDGCDVICVNLVDRTEPTTIIDMAEKSNVPIIFFNRELVEEDLKRWAELYYVGASAVESGVMQGEIAAQTFEEYPLADKNGDGIFQYVMLEGEAGHQDAIVRTEYSVSTMIEQNIAVEKLGYAIANWNRAQAQTKMTQMMEKYGTEIELVLANNDDMALGVIDALKEGGTPRADWPIIVGIDGTDVGLMAVENGEMAGTVYNDKEGQAKGMLDLAYALATKSDLTELQLKDNRYIKLSYAKVLPKDVDNYISQ